MIDFDEAMEAAEQRYGVTVRAMRVRAVQDPYFGRRQVSRRHRLLAASMLDPEILVNMLLTFDVGAHASGWLRNSDYDRCWHLSLSMGHPGNGGGGFIDPVPEIIRLWGRLVLGADVSKAWIEPPASKLDVHRHAPASPFVTHLRVFVDPRGESIVPAGEVYTLKPYDDGSSPEKIFR